MKKSRLISVFSAVMAILVIASLGSAQYSGYYMGTVYQLVNTSGAAVTIDIDYYDGTGNVQANAHRQFVDVEAGGSRIVVVPKDETNLGTGSYSAVVSSTGTIAGIVNEEFYAGTTTSNPHPPFASYSAADEGSNNVIVPSAMYNYYGYYTELFIQNIGTGDATDVTIKYTPATVNGIVVGTPKTDSSISIKQNATLKVSQETMTALGAPAGSGSFTGRFFGSVTVSSTSQQLAVVVNEHNVAQTKLFSTNGFPSGSTKVIAPAAMRGWYKYYTALTIANTSSTASACVHLTYNPDLSQSSLLALKSGGSSFVPVTANLVIPPSNSVIRYEGPDASASQTDLDSLYTRFTGSVTIESVVSGSTCPSATPIVAVQNVEAVAGPTSPNQAGSFNAIPVSKATNALVAPSVLANFYGLYTTMSIANTTGTAATCTITYTSGEFSTVGANIKKSYTHPLAANGSMMIYEGNPSAVDSRSDINNDASWKGGGSIGRFLGSAEIVCKDSSNAPVPVVGFVNEETNINGMDSMYTSNMINIPNK